MSGLFGGKSNNIEINNTENKVSALTLQQSSQGLPIPIVYGSTRITGNNLWYGNFLPVAHTSSTSSSSGGGGKGGGGSSSTTTVTTTTYTYTCGIAMALCEGPITSIGSVWADKDITDTTNLGFSTFLGTYPQTPWSYLTTNVPEQALAYPGTAYVANSALELGSSAYLPHMGFEVNGFLYNGTGTTVTTASLSGSSKNPRIALTNNFLTATMNSTVSAWGTVKGNVYKSTGKYFCEFTLPDPAAYHIMVGVVTGRDLVTDGNHLGITPSSFGYFGTNYPSGSGWNYWNGAAAAIGPVFAAGAVIGMAVDFAAETIYFYQNGVLIYTWVIGATLIQYGPVTPGISLWNSVGVPTVVTVNFGATAYAYGPPAGGYSNWSGATSAFDVLPGSVLSDILTNATYGAGFPSAQLQTPTDFNSYCTEMGFKCSPAYVTQIAAQGIVTELCMVGNSAPVWSEGLLKIIPYADSTVGSYVPNTTVQYDLTDDDFISTPGEDPIRVSRKRPADAYNAVSIECLNRNNAYNIHVVEVKDQANIDRYGLRPMAQLAMHSICVPATAQLIATAILARTLYFRNTYEFTIGWPYARLEAMDLVSLTDAGLGLDAATVRITSISEDDTGNLKITAEEFAEGVSDPATYDTQEVSGYIINRLAPPGNTATPMIFQPPLSITGTPQIWLGAAAQNVSPSMTPNWGGCEVHVSTDGGSTYTKAGNITAAAVYGELVNPLPAGADPDVTNSLDIDVSVSRGVLASVPQSQADALVTQCWVSGELLAYQTATLTASYTYSLDYLPRGRNWTSSIAHDAGDDFCLLNSAIFKAECPAAWVGTTLYVKLPAFTSNGSSVQNLADVTAFPYVVQNIGLVIFNGVVPNAIQSYEDLYVPSNTTTTIAGRATNHGRITLKGRLRITN